MEETMTLSIYRPMRLIDAMNRLFDESVLHPYDRPYVADERAYALPLDVIAKDDEYVITAAVPGLKPDDLSVEVLGETVTIRGEIKSEQNGEQDGYLLQERRYGKFSRTLNFPVELDGAKAEASVENGVLTLRVPKAETARPRTIKVKAR
jgi:HSP20 family protein